MPEQQESKGCINTIATGIGKLIIGGIVVVFSCLFLSAVLQNKNEGNSKGESPNNEQRKSVERKTEDTPDKNDNISDNQNEEKKKDTTSKSDNGTDSGPDSGEKEENRVLTAVEETEKWVKIKELDNKWVNKSKLEKTENGWIRINEKENEQENNSKEKEVSENENTGNQGQKEWRRIKTYSGSGGKNTSPFTITGNRWKIRWKVNGGKFGGVFQILVYRVDNNKLVDIVVNEQIKSESTKEDTTHIYQTGKYYLKINSANVNWEFTVEQLK